MTVTYMHHVHTAGKVGAFLRLLFLWKGSIYQGIWGDLLLFWLCYFSISFTYRLVLCEDEWMKQSFEKICIYFGHFDHWIPIGFVLGFYVTQVVNRWWEQFCSIPWPDKLGMNLLTFLPGGGERRRVRRYVVRLANLSACLCLRRMSAHVARRFPSFEHLVKAGLMTKSEQKKMEKINETVENLHQTTWYPLQWAQARLLSCHERGWIKSEFMMMELQRNLNEYAYFNGSLLCFSWVNIPLAYTQLVTIAVHVYFLVALFGRQYLNPTSKNSYKSIIFTGILLLQVYVVEAGQYVPVGLNRTIPGAVNLVGYDTNIHDFYFPLFTTLEFVFYFGWLKVAENLINPFGDDDDDFDIGYIIDRNFQVSYLMVNGEPDEELEEDTYGDEIPPATLPHTRKSCPKAEFIPIYITDGIIAEEQGQMVEDRPLFVSPSKQSLTDSETPTILNKWKRRVSSVLDLSGKMESIREHQRDVEKSSNNLLTIPQSYNIK